jgi:beta-galactosidase
MKEWTRRDVLKTGLAVPAIAIPAQSGLAAEAQVNSPDPGYQSDSSFAAAGRERLLLDFGWRFHFGHASDAAKDFGFGGGTSGNFQKTGNFLDASGIAFDDSDWKPVDLPHDWAIELPFRNDPELANKGFYPLGRGYPETSVGWYRRVFELPASDSSKRIAIEFDGSYRETMVVLNGYYVGRHSGGYDPFQFDVTDFANPGGRNVLLIRVDATLSDGWFYEGAGIYRHAWLVKANPVHVKRWGTFVRSEVRPREALLFVRTEVYNQGQGEKKTRVISTILDPSGKAVTKAAADAVPIVEWGDHIYEQQVVVKKPALWSLEQRNLYKLVTEVEAGGAVVDRYETRFGIRTIRFDAERGLLLNGNAVKLRGTCNHQDHAGLGVALPDAMQRYRIRKLQEMGSNAYRTSHNPPTPELLDACDELGMLVFDETRMMSSNPEGLSQFEHLVRRDRNHPCVFMWSMGNEEATANTPAGVRILSAMKRLAERHDGSRPLSLAPIFAIGVGGLAVGDVMGYNYMDPGADAYHNANPGKPVMGTEQVSAVGTRGIYVTDPTKGYVGSYDPYTTTGRASAEGWWRFCAERPWLAGGFVWTGFDYRGEPSPYQWPNISSQYGVIDTCGFPKDTFYYYQAWWTSRPVLHLFPHWNWPGMEGKEIAVWVHSNLERVELLLNGKSLGAKEMKKNSHLAWNVEYAPGRLEARGYRGGSQVLTAMRETTGPAAKLVTTADRAELAADGEDCVMLAVAVQDAQGRIVPVADNEVTFEVSGAGKLIGVGNGDPTSHESDKGASRKAFSGLCAAIVQSAKAAGAITIAATAPGLTPATATITAKPTRLRAHVTEWEREAPAGPGLTGVWRPVVGAGQVDLFGGGASMVFTFHQNGQKLVGTVEGGGGWFGGGGDTSATGEVEGTRVTFKTGNASYSGTIQGDELKLQRTIDLGPLGDFARAASTTSGEKAPAIGPPPDGTDPSIGSDIARVLAPQPVILRRAKR